jgi:hypothetical protein
MKIINIFLVLILLIGLSFAQGTNIVQVKNFYDDVIAYSNGSLANVYIKSDVNGEGVVFAGGA